MDLLPSRPPHFTQGPPMTKPNLTHITQAERDANKTP